MWDKHVDHREYPKIKISKGKRPTAKLTESDVLAIRELHKGGVGLVELAEKFGTTRNNIYCVVTYHTWRWLP